MTNLPYTGTFKVSCVYKKTGSWAAGYHTGIDLVGSSSKNIYATGNGTVYTTVSNHSSYGNYVVLKIDNQYHWFCHLSSIKVSKGDAVTRATIIGVEGSTGNSTGSHLHYEIRTSTNTYGVVEDPSAYMGISNVYGTVVDSTDSKYQIETTSTTTSTTTTTSTLKSTNEIAKEVIAGKWGNGTSRKTNLEKAGYNYTTIQAAVNALLK